ncbi:lipoprotein signal peptidase [Chamaesiphon minutus PCC 6605]|uniref:Lipoprotein signal peptidase n=1 Tax=Chamaesiphon minutus (strain ATCC 27169 / PCC 6605) TaxID=1173020 RepID=K9UF69_CHAP6|nr:lipoprotein signal peptidase [Chamaesiphon minutus PCC 6605]
MRIRVKNQTFWYAALLSLIIDQASKFLTVQFFDLGQTLPLLPGVFHLTYFTNKGAAFSLFSNSGGWLKWISLGVSLGLVVLALRANLSRWERVGYGCILGGALGNGVDRFVKAEVVDLLDFRLINFPVFNLADVAINIGIGCLLVAAFQERQRSDRAQRNKR